MSKDFIFNGEGLNEIEYLAAAKGNFRDTYMALVKREHPSDEDKALVDERTEGLSFTSVMRDDYPAVFKDDGYSMPPIILFYEGDLNKIADEDIQVKFNHLTGGRSWYKMDDDGSYLCACENPDEVVLVKQLYLAKDIDISKLDDAVRSVDTNHIAACNAALKDISNRNGGIYDDLSVDLILEGNDGDVIFFTIDSKEDTVVEARLAEPDEFKVHHSNYDTYQNLLLKRLESDHDIRYMSDECHGEVWNEIYFNGPGKIESQEGLKKYVSYCKENHITKSYLDSVYYNTRGDIMALREEKLLNTKSIVDCDNPRDEIKHCKENDHYISRIAALKCSADVEFKYLDSAHKDVSVDGEQCTVEDIEDIVASRTDFKNGTDVLMVRRIGDDGYDLCIRSYGQTYKDMKTSRVDMVVEDCTFKLKKDDKKVDVSEVLKKTAEKIKSIGRKR